MPDLFATPFGDYFKQPIDRTSHSGVRRPPYSDSFSGRVYRNCIGILSPLQSSNSLLRTCRLKTEQG